LSSLSKDKHVAALEEVAQNKENSSYERETAELAALLLTRSSDTQSIAGEGPSLSTNFPYVTSSPRRRTPFVAIPPSVSDCSP